MAHRQHAEPNATTTPESGASRARHRWLLLVHQLPPTPTNLRVKTWRRLQQLGAIAVKQAVYLLPDSASAREDFEWLKTEIEGSGGEATVFAANNVDAWADDALIEEFRRSRQESYGALASDADNVLRRLTTPGRRTRTAPARTPAWQRLLDGLRQRLTAIETIDFFGSAGRDRVVTLLGQIEQRMSAPGAGSSDANPREGKIDAGMYRNRLWVTRPRPGVDRMSSAWLITRFIDPAARFGFALDRDSVPRDGVPFDMFGVDFSHHGDHCTFETLCARFGVHDDAVTRIASIVHDLDLKDGRFGAPEAPTIATVIDGLQLAQADDDELLSQGMAMFDALYRGFAQSMRKTGPRTVASPSSKGRITKGRIGKDRTRNPRPRAAK